MEVIISPGAIEGRISANPSKSAMQRAVAAALMAKGKSIIYNPCLSDDCLAALEVIEKLGAHVQALYDHNQVDDPRVDGKRADKIEIVSDGVNPLTDELNCGESGLGIRMFTPIASLSDKDIVISGKGSLQERPVSFFEEVLPLLGVQCRTNHGKPPIQIRGPLQATDITVDGSLSSQFLTGLLMAFGAVAENVTITVQNLKSKPYIELTLQVMEHFGVKIEHEQLEKFHFTHKQVYHARDYTIEGDWSGGAFLLVAGAVAGQVEADNLNIRSTQSDKAILDALEKAGARVLRGMFTVMVDKAPLHAFDFDATDCPDLFPPLVALAANCPGVTTLQGVSRLAHKESDRGQALKQEFGKMGILVELHGDEMRIHGGTGIQAAEVHSHNDHRIAMACAVAALTAQGKIKVSAAAAVNKSYPEFWSHWQKLGGKVQVIATTTSSSPGV